MKKIKNQSKENFMKKSDIYYILFVYNRINEVVDKVMCTTNWPCWIAIETVVYRVKRAQLWNLMIKIEEMKRG